MSANKFNFLIQAEEEERRTRVNIKCIHSRTHTHKQIEEKPVESIFA